MKATINGKRYDTAKCEELGEHRHYNNGNLSGTTSLMRADDGQLLVFTDTNGQDCYLHDQLRVWNDNDDSIDSYDMDEEQEKRCQELGLITIV